MAASPSETRLPSTFNDGFFPLRPHLKAILAFAAREGEGTKEAIQDETGIPTGESTGKVVPHIRYAAGMGLTVDERKPGGVFAPRLTALGREVHQQDPGLDEPFSQWLAHLNLCRRHGGAELWHLVFAGGFVRLGASFAAAELESLVARELGTAKLAPLLGMYREPQAFARARVLEVESEPLKRQAAPLTRYWAAGYAVWMFDAWETRFPGRKQLSAREFEAETDLFAAAGWSGAQTQEALELLATIGALRVERQLDDAVLTRLGEAASFLPRMYSSLP